MLANPNESSSQTKHSPNTASTEELLTKKELAQKLKISTRKIELDPEMPVVRLGRSVRYDWNDVLNYLKGGTPA